MEVLVESDECMRRVTMTLIEMLRDRGYNMEHEKAIYERFSAHELPTSNYKLEGKALNHTTGRRIAYTMRTEAPSATYTKEDTIKHVKNTYMPFLKTNVNAESSPDRVHSVIVILDKPLQSSTYNNNHLGDDIEVFLKRDLLFNVTKHALVPEHRLLRKTEKSVTLKILHLKEEDLKGLHQNDPIVCYFGGKIGDIFYIQRFEVLNTGPVRSRPELRVVKYVAEKDETKPAAIIKARAHHMPKGIEYEKWRNMRMPRIRVFQPVPELDDWLIEEESVDFDE